MSNKGGKTDQNTVYSHLEYSKKPPWTLTLELKMKDRSVKYVLCVGRRVHVGGGRVNGGNEEGWIGSMYFVYIYDIEQLNFLQLL
jgi:hypothetical protein